MLSRHARQTGFTLIEMLVVVIIIGIVISTMVISIRTGDLGEQMENELVRMRSLINLARDEAVLQGYDVALAIKEDGYSFQWYDIKEQRWQAFTDDKVFRERPLLPGTRFVLVIDDLPVKEKPSRPGLSESNTDKDKKQAVEDENVQRVIIFPSGDVFPFELILRKDDESLQFKLVTSESGEIEIELPDEIS